LLSRGRQQIHNRKQTKKKTPMAPKMAPMMSAFGVLEEWGVVVVVGW
jgi:hypothetical protein